MASTGSKPGHTTAASSVPITPAVVSSPLAAKIGFLKPYVTGGAAAMFASTCIHPIDLVKVRLQVGGADATAFGILRNVVSTNGITGLYAGLSASLMRQATYGTARIGLHTVFSRKLKERRGNDEPLPVYLSFASAFASGAMASAIGNPFDVALVRFQGDGLLPPAERRGYTNVINAVTRIVREEGFSALYHGYPPTLMRAIGMNVGMMASYDQAHDRIAKWNGLNRGTDLMSSAVAGFFCAFFSLPFDMMKSRLQFMTEGQYKGVGDVFVKILRHEGVLTFWRGFGAYYLRCAPHAMIILMTRAQLIRWWDEKIGK